MWVAIVAALVVLSPVVASIAVWLWVRRTVRVLSSILAGHARRATRDRERVDLLAEHVATLRKILRDSGIDPDDLDGTVARFGHMRDKAHERERLMWALQRQVHLAREEDHGC